MLKNLSKLGILSISVIAMLCIVPAIMKAQKRATAGARAIGQAAVWKPSRAGIQKLAECGSSQNPAQCVFSVMRQSGAPIAAIEFTAMFRGFTDEVGLMDSFREMGKVDLAGVYYPFRVNSNEGFLLVNGTPQVVETNLTGEYQENTDYIAERKRVNIKTDTLYRSLVSRFPKLELELSRNTFENMRTMAQGGQEFVFSYALLNGCRACEAVGHAHVAFSFDHFGTFTGTKLLRLSSITAIRAEYGLRRIRQR